MTVKWPTAMRNAQGDAWEATIGPAPFIQLWSGAEPASTSATPAGQKLAELALAADWSPPASGGAKTLAGLPLSTTGLAAAGAGTAATFYRFVDGGGVCQEQGAIPADMTIDNASIASGQTVQITSYTKTWAGA